MPRARSKEWKLKPPKIPLAGMQFDYPAAVLDVLLGDEFLRVQSVAKRQECRTQIIQIAALFDWQREMECRPTRGQKKAALQELRDALSLASGMLSRLDTDSQQLVKEALGRARLNDDLSERYGYSQAFLDGFKDRGAYCLGECILPEASQSLLGLFRAADEALEELSNLPLQPLEKGVRLSERDAVNALLSLWRATSTVKSNLTVRRLRDFAVTALTPVYEQRGEPVSDLLHASEMAL